MREPESATDASPFVDAGWIADHVDDPGVRIVEFDVSNAVYESGHIPGAVLWNAYGDLRGPGYVPVSSADFEQLLSRSGIAPETCVVFYGYSPHLGFWLLKASGHDNVRLMDGSRDKWTDAGHDWSTDAPRPTPTSYSFPTGRPELQSSRQEIEAMIGQPDAVILDVRAQLEYDGERFWPSGATEDTGRAGHVPTSVHVAIDLLRADGEFRATNEIRQVLLDHGVTPDKRVVAYCTIGNRASQAWFALTYLLDYPDAAVYYGSWAEWGKLADTAVEP